MNDIVPVVSEQLNKSLAVNTAESVLSRLFKEIDKLKAPSPRDVEWFSSMLNVVAFSQQIEIGFGHARAYALAIVKDNWDNLDLELRKQYGYNFEKFAVNVTGKQPSTIDNYIRTARIWFVEGKNPGKQIERTLRSPEGRPVRDEKGKVIVELVDFVPYMVDMSKLLAVNSRAANGTMTTRLWEMLVDDYYTCEDVQIEAAGKSAEEPDYYRPSFFVLGPGLYAQLNGKTVMVAEYLNWEEYDTNPDVKTAMDVLLKVLDVLREEDRIHEMEREINKGPAP